MADTGRSFLERSIPWWHVSFVVILGVTAFIDLVAADLPSGRRLVVAALLALIAVMYAAVGARYFMSSSVSPPRAIAYLIPLGTATCVLLAIAPDGSHLLLFIVFPHIWALLRVRWAIAASAVFVAAIVAIEVGQLSGDLAGPLTRGLFMLALAVLMGVWLSGIIAESERRQALIDELTAARAALDRAHHRAGVLAERQRLASEIHDTLAQGLMSSLVLSQAPATPERMAKIERTARENLAEARSLIEALEPKELRDATLADACGRVVERFAADSDGTRATFLCAGEPRVLPVNCEIVLLRATQEALANVRKHADASCVDVRLSYGENGTTIRIHDNGAGFDPAAPTDGFGLRGLWNRAQQVNGTVDVRSVPGRGTTVEVTVP